MKHYLLLLAILPLLACNKDVSGSDPVGDINNETSGQNPLIIETLTPNQLPVKLDILFVIDNSATMCQEQQSLVEGFDAFASSLQTYLDLDIQVAVVTTDPVLGAGVFNDEPATEDPLSCEEAPADCSPLTDAILNNDMLKHFKCIASVGADQNFTANLESGIKTSWLALDPEGPNAVQASSFLRDDARLLIIYLSDEEDCSIDEDFCSPSYDCDDDDDCLQGSECKEVDAPYGKTSLCCGTIKKDYYNVCSLLGEYKGEEHHQCAYNLGCQDCESDDDCEDGWHCKSELKCRPKIYGFNTIASFQEPSGTPLFALSRLTKHYTRLRSLKTDPGHILVAAITGDGQVSGSDASSLISEACLDDVDLDKCLHYKDVSGSASTNCVDSPESEGCEELFEAKLECIRQCFIASKGDNTNPQAKNSYVCTSDHGKADLGSRYIRLVEMFGPNGTHASICDSSGLTNALAQISDMVLHRTIKRCLTVDVKAGETVTVTLQEAGAAEAVVLSEGPDGDYQIVTDEDCTGTGKAVVFSDLPSPDATIEISYIGVSPAN